MRFKIWTSPCLLGVYFLLSFQLNAWHMQGVNNAILKPYRNSLWLDNSPVWYFWCYASSLGAGTFLNGCYFYLRFFVKWFQSILLEGSERSCYCTCVQYRSQSADSIALNLAGGLYTSRISSYVCIACNNANKDTFFSVFLSIADHS